MNSALGWIEKGARWIHKCMNEWPSHPVGTHQSGFPFVQRCRYSSVCVVPPSGGREDVLLLQREALCNWSHPLLFTRSKYITTGHNRVVGIMFKHMI